MAEGSNQGRTLDRALDIMECVESARSPLRPAQIAKATGLPISTTQRIAAALLRRGYLTSLGGSYVLGPAVLAHAHAFVLQDRLTTVANPILADVTETTGMTSSVYVRTGWSRILIARAEPPHPLRYQFPVGQRLPLDVGAGKVLLAQMPDEEIQEYLQAYTGVSLANGATQSADTLRADITEIRAAGFHLGRAERHPGVISLNLPIVSTADVPLGALNLVSNDEATTPVAIRKHRGLLYQASQQIGQQF